MGQHIGTMDALSLEFEFDSDDRVLIATFPLDQVTKITSEQIQEAVSQAGHGNLQIIEENIQTLIQNAAKGMPNSIAVARAIDAKVSIAITEDKSKALLSVTPAQGGNDASIEHVHAALLDAKITTSVDEEAILSILANETIENIVIAQASEPTVGDDGYIKQLLFTEGEQSFAIVDVNTPLLMRVPATQGEPGTNVLGEPIAGRKGREKSLPEPQNGVAISDSDSDVLVSTIRGVPLFHNNNVKIDLPIAITLNFDDESGVVIAQAALSENPTPNSETWLNEALKSAGFGAFYRHEAKIKALLEQARNGKECTHDIAERRDGSYELLFSANNTELTISVTNPHGGKKISKEILMQDLATRGVVFGILEDKIDDALHDESEESVLIAQGQLPIVGDDAHFEVLFITKKSTKPKIDANGNADFKNIQEFVVIEPGTPLMRRHPATLGEAGKDIYGNEIPATPGVDEDFADELEGVRRAQSDNNVLEAAIKGHPVIKDNSVRVENILNLDVVDMTTGNIDFDGSVQIKGDVCAGFSVRATGDVLINGSANACIIESGGSITMSNGVIGGARKNEDAVEEDENGDKIIRGTLLRCAGDIEARYIDNSRIEAKGTVIVSDYIIHSKIIRANMVSVGQQGGKGLLLGGETHANREVACNILGSISSTHSTIQVGIDNAICLEYEDAINQLSKRQAQYDEIHIATKKLETPTRNDAEQTQQEQDLLSRAKLTLQKLETAIKTLSEKKDSLTHLIESAQDASVSVVQQCFDPATITINGKNYRVLEESAGGTFKLHGNIIKFTT